MPIYYGITQKIRDAVAARLRAAGVTEKTISENIAWDEFVWNCYHRSEYIEYWKGVGQFGDYIAEMTFITAMTTD